MPVFNRHLGATNSGAATSSLVVIAALLLSAASAWGGQQIHDLGAEPNALGTTLPAGLTRNAVLRLVAPEVDPTMVTLVGAKPWPHLANGYVAVVCAAHDAADRPQAGTPPACVANPDVYLGVLRMPPGGEPRLVAPTPKGFVLTSDWSPPKGAPILLPSVTPADPDNWAADRSDASLAAFDLAPYRIAPDTYAFGLRSDQAELYSGGLGTFQTLHLFWIDGNTLRRVLAQPIDADGIYSDWNKDGTRQHVESEAKLTLVVLPHMTAGHYDLRVTEIGKKGSTSVLRWDAAQRAYWVPVAKPAD